jgi:DNA-binding NtrC family response regulator
MPGTDGVRFVETLRERGLSVPVVIMTAFGSIESAVRAIKAGAQDYLVKPFAPEVLRVLVHRILSQRKVEMAAPTAPVPSIGGLIGRSPQMQNVFRLIQKVAKSSANVVILGESGTGKEMVAKAIHNEGPRATKPFVAINCAAIPDALLESELFGHAKGSFTGAMFQKRGLLEEANGGTFFLDEIADMNISLQAKLLRVLQDRQIKPVGQNTFKDIDVRIIAATHKDFPTLIENGLFREDLYYRLSVIPIMLPPLRERGDDVALFAEYFLKKFIANNHSQVRGFTPEALKKIGLAHWEGNVRQLENTIERAVILCDEPLIDVHHIFQVEPRERDKSPTMAEIPKSLSIVEMEKKCIEAALEQSRGKKDRAAKILGISRKTLYRKEREYGIAF